MADKNQPAPLPRDYDQATFSEMLPFRSKKIRLWRSPVLWFVGVTALLNVALFKYRVDVLNSDTIQGKMATFELIVQSAMFYLMSMALLLVHSYAKSDKPIAYYVFPCAVVFVFLNTPILWHYYAIPFDILGGGFKAMEDPSSWLIRLRAAVFGPGLREELVKGLPALIGAAITVWTASFTFLSPRLRNILRVRGPLDGVLVAAAAGCAFLFFETGGEYVHGVLGKYLRASNGNMDGAIGSGLMLLLPRVMNGWVGHIAWAIIFGYAIGLAVVRPRHGWKLVLGGWFVASVLHGLWDSDAPGGMLAMIVIGGVGGVLAVACFVKARQLEGSLLGRQVETFGSIVVGSPAAPVMATPAFAFAPAPAAVAPMPQAVAPAPAVVAPPPVAVGLALDLSGVRVPLQSGATLDLAAHPALAGRAAGVRGQVTHHPTNPGVLGLKNLGAATWYARLRDNTIQPVEPQRNLRLAPGMSVDFGAGLVGTVVAA